MRILFDFRSYQISQERGIGRYILGLAEAMTELENVSISVLLSEKLSAVEFNENFRKKISIYSAENFSNYEIAENFDFFFKGNFFDYRGFEEYMYPAEIISKCNDVVGILHDLIPLIFSKNYLNTPELKKEYIAQFELMKYVSHFFCNSECTASDGQKLMNRAADYFTTIYGGADYNKFQSPNSHEEYKGKERTNNIVFIAGADKRKNFHGAAKAFAKAWETGKLPADAKLYLICKSDKWFIQEVQNEIADSQAKIGEQIIITGFIPDNEVVNILSTAKASIFPSFYEGLGLPILESYIAGTPCFASNISATREFVNVESSFDPYNNDEIKKIIIRIFNDEDFCKQSLAFGRKLVERINWQNAAKITVKKLKELKTRKKENKKIAVFSVLPPQRTGIAPYSYKLHTADIKKYDVFSDIATFQDYKNLISDKYNNIFPISFFDYAALMNDYQGKVFVIGNSEHHLASLEKAIESKREKNRWLYLHEAFVFFAFFPLFNFDMEKIKSFAADWYPEYLKNISSISSGSQIYDIFMKSKIYGIRPLINMTGIRKIFVNNEKAAQLIREELTDEEFSSLHIEILFHPIENLQNISAVNLKNNKKQLVVGSFGIPDKTKMTEEIISAVELLNEAGHNIKLVLAGYNAASIKTKGYNFLEIYDSPNTEKLYSLMKSVDLAIQLRPDSHGESSGCIAQLLGVGQNVLTSKGFVSDDIAQYCHIIDGHPIVADLAVSILHAVQNKKIYNNKVLANKYSFSKLSEILYNKTLQYRD